MVRVYNAESELKALCYDVERMIRDKENPKLVFTMIRNKIERLENPPPYIKIHFWNEEKRKNYFKKTLDELQESKKDILDYIKQDELEDC